METVTTLPRGPMTVGDLDAYRDARLDDGHRCELIDGTLIVTPAPVLRHQLVVSELMGLLRLACPTDLRVLTAPADVVLADDTVVQPDVLVARRAHLIGAKLLARPLLAVEILSPSTRLFDLDLKRARYERAGVASYWAIDPEELWLRAWEPREGEYVEVAHVAGGDSWAASSPYAVTVTPGRLAD